MSGSKITVRCLASTRIEQQRQQQQQPMNEQEHENNLETFRERGILQHETNANTLVLARSMDLDEDSASDCRSNSEAESVSDTSSEAHGDKTSTTGSTKKPEVGPISCIQEAELSPDGSCIFTADENRSLSVYPVASNLFTEQSAQPLRPYSRLTSSNPIWSFAVNPQFDVNDANTTHVLLSRRDCYITLHNALWDISCMHDASITTVNDGPVDISKSLYHYKLVNSLTEAVTGPLSLTYSNDSKQFFAGTQNAILTYDLTSSEPIHTIATIPSARNKLKGGGRGFKGWISALATSPSSTQSDAGLIAAGSRTRFIGLYDSTSGTEVTSVALPGTINGRKSRDEKCRELMGDGVSSLKWSPCARYLYVAERSSDALLIYDVRNFSFALGHCAERKAITKQKIGFDVWSAGVSSDGGDVVSHEIWAGGTDGCVRVWSDPWAKEGAVQADDILQVGAGDAPVVGTMVHSSGQVAVAACGRRYVGEDMTSRGRRKGGGRLPSYEEWGSVDILGLS